MGIAGLLPQLRSITTRAHVSKYRGQTVAVDAYCLLHRGSYSCARELVEGEPTDRHVAYCMGRMEMLLGAGVRPLVVFDGGRLPNKAEEERARERNREESKARARSLWAQGNRAAAMECYQKAVDITPAHAKQLVEALKARGIPFIVAPYEADAQMAYLAHQGLVGAVVTEDSDLLCYGCPVVFFKMDKAGEGEEVRLADLPSAKELALQGFGHDLFQEMCVLAGCDFVPSIPGIGVKKAHQHLRRSRCFLKVVRALRWDGATIPQDYERRVQRALWTFQHQRVYCPRRCAVVHLHEVAGGGLQAGARVPAAAQLVGGEPDFLGPMLPDDVAQGIAEGDLDPITKQPFSSADLQPCTAPLAADGVANGSGGLQWPPAGGQPKSGSGKSGGVQLGAGNGGNTLTKYLLRGSLRGLTKPASAADFKAPRASTSQPGSQGSQPEQAAAARAGKRHRQPVAAAAEEAADEEEVASPRADAQPPAAGGDTLGSPTEEQWERFRLLRRKGARAPLLPASAAASAAAAAPEIAAAAAPTTTSCSAGPVAEQQQLDATQQGGTLLSRLRAALQEEPSVADLLRQRQQQAEGEGEQEEDEQPQGQAQPRKRFITPLRQQQQQAQADKSPLEALGLRPSPTIDDLLGGSGGATSDSESEQLLSLACSPLAAQPRPSQRLLPFGRASGAVRQQPTEQVQQIQVDLVSPAGQAAMQVQQQQQPDGNGGGITPGFYVGGSGGITPGFYVGGSGASQPDSDASPIASLSHVAAFEPKAEAAMERVVQAALAATTQQNLRLLPPPRHLQGVAAAGAGGGAKSPAAPAPPATKRPVLGLKENRLLATVGGSRRGKSGGVRQGGGATAAASANPFSGFAI